MTYIQAQNSCTRSNIDVLYLYISIRSTMNRITDQRFLAGLNQNIDGIIFGKSQMSYMNYLDYL